MSTDRIKIKPDWTKSKEDVWNEKFAGMMGEDTVYAGRLRRRRMWAYAAAAMAALVMLTSVSHMYTRNITVPKGEHLSVVLPDGSKVELNADSRLSYRPLWWKLSREVKLDGEAYFEVEKGRTFDVVSGDAVVSVLGTSFNVFARDKNYNVTCLTGRVAVSKESQSVTLGSGTKAVFSDNRLITSDVIDAEIAVSWTKNKFVFSGVPLYEVIKEIERQYNIKVDARGMKPDYLYSGNFSKTDDPRQLLQIIGKPFGVEFTIE